LESTRPRQTQPRARHGRRAEAPVKFGSKLNPTVQPSGGPGSFRPQVVKVQHSQSTLLGDTKAKILRGDLSSMIRCSSGGHNTLAFAPALRKGNPFQGATDASGCRLLIEVVIR
jgi:hypothetical protein